MEFFGVLVIIVLLVGLISALGRPSPESIGQNGEKKVIRKLRSKLDPAVYRQFHDITLPVGSGETQIDHVVVSPYGVFVIETKNYSGWIFGDSHSRVWTQTFRRSKHKFQNPLRQNYKHTKAIESFLSVPSAYVHSVVVFVGNAEFRTKMPGNVVHLNRLCSYILAQREQMFGKAGINRMAQLLADQKAGIQRKAPRSAHLQSVRNQPNCPNCGAYMLRRKVREGANRGKEFWGCPTFPSCRGTRDLQVVSTLN